ncbi:MAG TPA: porin family protein [Candidatus Angelobacter sp.]|jgi:opacity protein-like surface antigen
MIFLTASGLAQDFRSEFSVQGTANVPKNSDNLDIPHEATNSGGFMLGYRYNFKPWFAVQGDYGYTRNTQKYFDPVFGETDIQANLHQLTGEAVITAPAHNRVRPYGLAGIGGLFFRPTNSLNNAFFGISNNTGNSQTKAAFVYGGGVDFDLTHSVAFRAEYRGYLYKIPDFQITGLATDNFTHLAQPSVGLVWRF